MNALIGLLSALGAAIQSIFKFLELRYVTERNDRIAKEAKDAKDKEAEDRQEFTDRVHVDVQSEWLRKFRNADSTDSTDSTVESESTSRKTEAIKSGVHRGTG
jgi:hypothetical protein